MVTYRAVEAALACTAAGRWFVRLHRVPVERIGGISALVGVYLLLDESDAIVYLGQAARQHGVAARVAEHLAVAERAAVVRGVVVVELDDHTPMTALSAVEGRLASALRLGKALRSHRWPRADDWARSVTAEAPWAGRSPS